MRERGRVAQEGETGGVRGRERWRQASAAALRMVRESEGEEVAAGVGGGADDASICPEVQAGGGEEVGQAGAGAEGEGAAKIGDGVGRVGEGAAVELDGAEAGDGVLDVIKGELEDVALALPQSVAGVLKAGPVEVGAQALMLSAPGAIAAVGIGGVARVGVKPVLEGVDGGGVGEEEDELLELVAGRERAGVGVVEGVEVGAAEQLHAHGGELAELDRGAAVPDQGIVGAGHGVEGVAALVEEGQDVLVAADGAGADEGEAAGLELDLKTSGGLTWP